MSVLSIAGVFNARDVGGMPAHGGTIRARRLLRSGNLVDATPAGVAELERLVSHIVDLRDDMEVASAPSATAGIPTTHLPLFLGSVASFFEDDMSLDQMYLQMLEESGERLVDALRIIAREKATLVHCTVGKDRTGVTVALALAAVGADRAAIIDDYALTASLLPQERNRKIVAYLEMQHPEAQHAVALATLSPADVMERVLTHIDDQWGSAADYLTSNGMTPGELEALRTTLVEA